MTAPLTALEARLADATGPDREIDFAIHDYFFPPDQARVTEDVVLPEGFGQDELSRAMDPRPHYTTSLDAIVALIEKRLPGWKLSIYNHPAPCASLISPENYDDVLCAPFTSGGRPNMAIACCHVLVRALARESGEDN